MLPNKLPNPLPTFLGNISIPHIHSVQLFPELQLCPVLQITRTGKNWNSGTLQHILDIFFNKSCCMTAGFWADKLYSKSHTQKIKWGFYKVFSYLKKNNPVYDHCYAKMQPDSALGCIAFPPIDFKMNKLSLGIWEFIAVKTYSGRSTQTLFIGLNSVCHLK